MARTFPAKSQKRTKGKGRGLIPMTRNQAMAPSFEELGRQFANCAAVHQPIESMTSAQGDYLASMEQNILTFGVGPAGTGKTFMAAARAAQALVEGEVDRIIVTRPAVEAGAPLGFLPGELEDKFGPYLAPFKTELEKRLGRGMVEMFLKNEKILALPLAYMRGWNFDRAFVILDEAQNTTPVEMKLLLTRVGEGARVVVDGDPRQKDIPGPSGLIDALEKLRGMPGVGTVYFTRDDIVRSGFVRDVCERYET